MATALNRRSCLSMFRLPFRYVISTQLTTSSSFFSGGADCGLKSCLLYPSLARAVLGALRSRSDEAATFLWVAIQWH